MTKEQYKAKLQKKYGYRFNGDIACLNTPSGVWFQKIVQVDDPLFGKFGLVTVDPCDLKKKEGKK